AAIDSLPDAKLRAALLDTHDAADAANASKGALLLEVAQKNLGKNVPAPPTFNMEMHAYAAKAAVMLAKLDAAFSEAKIAVDGWHSQSGVRARRNEVVLGVLLSQIAASGGHPEDAVRFAEAAAHIAVET